METKPEKKRGGARAGAGRKPLENARTIRLSLMLSPLAAANLQKLCDEHGTGKNDAINKLLESL